MNGLKVLATEKYQGISVTYYHKLFDSAQKARLIIQGMPPGSGVCVSLYGWFPDGRIVLLDRECNGHGKSSVFNLNIRNIKEYLVNWKGYLSKHRNSIDLLEPGILALIAIDKPGQGVFGLFKGVPLSIENVVDNKASVKIIIGKNSVEEALKHPLLGFAKKSQSINRGDMKVDEEWPPSHWLVNGRYYWQLVNVISERLNAYVPTSMVRLVLDNSATINDVSSIVLGEKFEIKGENSIGFTATYHISQPYQGVDVSYAEYGAVGPLYTLKKTAIYLNFAALFKPGSTLDTQLYEGLGSSNVVAKTVKIQIQGNDLLLMIGIKADIALAKYCLAVTESAGNVACIRYANFTLIRPVVDNDVMHYWAKAEQFPSYDRFAKDYSTIALYWNSTDYGYYKNILEIYYDSVTSRYNTISLLGVSTPIIPLLIDDVPLALVPVVSAGLGYTEKTESRSLLHLEIILNNDNLYIHPIGFYGPKKLYYESNSYTIGSMVFYIGVTHGGGIPCPPYGPCPTSNNTAPRS
ncbi:hypothetical protein PYJP_12540 [Pyrofollis japonicus]|nr:hypothetical protein PYJP_12540 [Pyrofollis japonicus]